MQLNFNFPFISEYSEEEFFVSGINKSLFDFISNYEKNSFLFPKIFAVYGPRYSGKTHISHIWRDKVDAEFLNVEDLDIEYLVNSTKDKSYIIDDFDKINDQFKLFHILNFVLQTDNNLLITTSTPINEMANKIVDLKSRIQNIVYFEIRDPDKNLAKVLLIKNLSDRQIVIRENVINFVLKRLRPSFQDIHNFVKMLELYCFEKKRKATIPIVKEVSKVINLPI